MGRSVAVLIPSTTLSACPGDEVVVKCYESETTANTRISLRWEITLINTMIAEIELPLSDIMNQSQRQEAGLQFYAKLTSYSPLTAILNITARPTLDGATVTCGSLSTTSRDTLIIRVTQIGNSNKKLIVSRLNK